LKDVISKEESLTDQLNMSNQKVEHLTIKLNEVSKSKNKTEHLLMKHEKNSQVSN